MTDLPVTLVVLAGGRSRRFGSDKLAAEVAGIPLLHRCLAQVPADWELVIVGDPRPLPRPARFVREQPPGGGPAAALVAGVRASGPDRLVVTTPGDTPRGGVAALALVAALLRSDEDAVVGQDSDAVVQPLQLALRGTAAARIAALPEATVVGVSARRRLLPVIEPVPVPLPLALTFDVDTPAQAYAFRE